MSEYFDFHIMKGAPDEADLLLGNMFFTIRSSYDTDVGKAWSALHPDVRWVGTLVISSALMDALSPPEVRLAERWQFDKFRRRLEALAQKHGVATGNLSDLWPSLLRGDKTGNCWVRDETRRLEKEFRLPRGTLRRLARQARKALAFVKLGCCIRLDKSRLELLHAHFEAEVLQKLSVGKAVCFLDGERIWNTAENLLRANELPDSAGRKDVVARILGWIVWFHEQSHATRGVSGTPEEEVEAQLETYRMCDEAQFEYFAQKHIGGPTYRQIMKRLAQRQPPPYSVVFSKAFRNTLAVY